MSSPARLPLTGAATAASGQRSALLAAWATAYLGGQVDASTAIDEVTGADEPHAVAGLDAGADLAALLADLRGRGARGLALVLPVPGDPRGLPGPGPLSALALEVGEAVRVVGSGAAYGLVPALEWHGTASDGYAVTVCWRVLPAAAAAPSPPGAGRQAERDLNDALREATGILHSLDVARLSAPARDALLVVRSARPLVGLPRGFPAEAKALWLQADRLAAFLDVAAADDGAAVDRSTTMRRRDVLRELAGAVRRAKVAAINAALDAPV